MKELAATVFAVFLGAALANAQTNLGSGAYSISGIVLSQGIASAGDVDVRLFTDTEMLVGSTRTQTYTPFRFGGLRNGTYYIEVEGAGLETTRQRVDFMGMQRDVNITMMPDPQAQSGFRDPVDYSSDNDVVDIKDLKRSPEALKQFQAALKKLQKGDVNGARTRLESLVAASPDFYEAHKTLGVAYQRGGYFREAEREYRIARDLKPASSAPLLHLGSLYLEQAVDSKERDAPLQDILENARSVLRRAVELSPGDAFTRYLLGVAYYRLGSYSDAESTLIHALDMDPELGDTRLALANVYIKTQDWSKALSHIDIYLKENPRSSTRDNVEAIRAKVAELVSHGAANAGKESRNR